MFLFRPNIRPLFRRNRNFAETLIFGRNSPKPNIRSVTSYNAEQSKLDKFWKLMINCYQNQKFNDFKFLINFVVIEQFNVNTEIRYIFIHIHICVHVLLDRKWNKNNLMLSLMLTSYKILKLSTAMIFLNCSCSIFYFG